MTKAAFCHPHAGQAMADLLTARMVVMRVSRPRPFG